MAQEVKALTAYVEFRAETAKLRQEMNALLSEIRGQQAIPLKFNVNQQEAIRGIRAVREEANIATRQFVTMQAEVAKARVLPSNIATPFSLKPYAGVLGGAAAQTGLPLASPVASLASRAAVGGGIGALGLAGAAAGIGAFAATAAINQKANESYGESVERLIKQLTGLAKVEQEVADKRKAALDSLTQAREASRGLADEIAARQQGPAGVAQLRARQQREEAEKRLGELTTQETEAGAEARSLRNGFTGGQSPLEWLPIAGVYFDEKRSTQRAGAEEREKVLRAERAEQEKIVALLKEEEERLKAAAKQREAQLRAARQIAEVQERAESKARMAGQRLAFNRAGGTDAEGRGLVSALLGGNLGGAVGTLADVGGRKERAEKLAGLQEREADINERRREIVDRFKPGDGRSSFRGLEDFGKSLVTDTFNSAREAAERDKKRNELLEKNNEEMAKVRAEITKLTPGGVVGG